VDDDAIAEAVRQTDEVNGVFAAAEEAQLSAEPLTFRLEGRAQGYEVLDLTGCCSKSPWRSAGFAV
jgi:hypothetical protein